MKVYISVDMEGIAGVSAWEDVNRTSSTYERYRKQMNLEALAAIRGAIGAGAKNITVKDAHATGRNLYFEDLPSQVSLINGWSGCPSSMVQGLDSSYDALIFIGYHAPAGSNGNPLAHTMSSRKVHEMRLNGQRTSEFDLHATLASEIGVPVAFISGDETICLHAKDKVPSMQYFAALKGVGNSSICASPSLAISSIEELVKQSLEAKNIHLYPASKNYSLEVDFVDPQDAYAASFFPGAEQSSERTVVIRSSKFFDVMTFIKFSL